MSYKTILVHVNDERRVAGLIDAAMQIGSRFDAHVTALYVMPPMPTYAPTLFGAGLMKAGYAALKEASERVRMAFEEASRGRSVVPEWILVDPVERKVADCVLEHARAADLVIVSQSDPGFSLSSELDVPERMVIESGRPVLIIPHAGRFPEIGKRVTVAWNMRREASRAVFDALPLLKAAERVRIVWVNPQREPELAKDLPGTDIANTLARHGVTCEVATAVASDISVGDVILSGLTDDSADLLVMGAWGHSRMREIVFGGATRHILAHMTVPVLMAH